MISLFWIHLTLPTYLFHTVQYLEKNNHKSGAQEHLLGWSLFLVWMDFTIFLARFDLFGRPIYLTWHVLSNVAWSLIVYIPSIFAFSLAFHSFLKTNKIFQGSISSVIKTLTMMLGEFDFEENFVFNEVKDSNYSVQVIVFVALLRRL